MEIRNKKAFFDYQVVAVYEVGIVLKGAEVKSVRGGGVNLTGSRVLTKEDGIWVVGMTIQKYVFDGSDDYDQMKTRRLLAKRSEIVAMDTKMRSEGLTAVPLRVYTKGDLIKVEIGLVRGKKKYEKREEMKKRSEERGLAVRLKNER